MTHLRRETQRIGAEAQLLFDDDLIADRRGVERVEHTAVKHSEPVLSPSQPWEGSRVLIFGSVVREQGLLRMWYASRCVSDLAKSRRRCPGLFNGNLVCYAESDDGLTWRRPDLCIYPYDGSLQNNITFLNLHHPCVLKDPVDTSPTRRYKLTGTLRSFDVWLGHPLNEGYSAADSPDGLRWTPRGPKLLPTGGENHSIIYDPVFGRYVAFLRTRGSVPNAAVREDRRTVSVSTSLDFEIWDEPKLALVPDARDDAWASAPGERSEFYWLTGFRHESHMVGLLADFRIDGSFQKAPNEGVIAVQLAHSRDGVAWRRSDSRKPVLAPGEPGAFDAGVILGTASEPVRYDDRMELYYTGLNTRHGAPAEEKRSCIGLARWRPHGFVSLRATGAGGMIETHPLLAPDGGLTVNADASGGKLVAEILTADGAPIPGFGASDCIPVETDALTHVMRWRRGGAAGLPRPLRVRFHLEQADLFSFRLADPGAGW